VIRFSAILVAGALAVLIAGVLATSLALVYLSIGVSVLASVLLAIGVILRRKEIFGETGAAAASGQPAWPVTPATGTPVMVGGRARIPEAGPSPEEAGRRPAGAGAGSGNGSSGGQAGRGVAPEIRWAWQEQEGSPEAGPARAAQERNGPGRNGTGQDGTGQDGTGQDGPARGGPARSGRTGGYSGTHGSGRGRPPAAPPSRRPPAAPPVGTAPRGAREPAASGPTYAAADSGQGTRPDQPGRGTRPDQPGRGTPPDQPGRGTPPDQPGCATRPDQRTAGTAPPGRGAGPPEWPVADITWREPTDARRPSREPDTREPDGGWVFTPPMPPPDVPASPAEEPDAPAAGGPDRDITERESARDRWLPREPEDRVSAPPTPPDRPLSPAGPDRPASPNDDFWDRVNEELATDAQREADTPSRASSAGRPPPAAGGDLWSRPADRPADEAAGAGSSTGGPGPGRSGAGERWSAWAPNVSSRPDSPAAGDEDEPRDRAAEGAAGQEAEAGTLGPLFAWRDAAADHAGASGTREEPATAEKEPAGAGQEAADAGKEADVEAEEADEEEEAAPSPWSIPLTLVGDVSDLDEEDDAQPAGSGAVEDHGTGKPPAGGERPAPERAGSDVWARRSWAGAEEKQAGPAEADGGAGPGKPDEADGAGAGAGRSPWLIRPGKDATAGWAGQDAGDVAPARAGDKADAAEDSAGADDDAKATPAGRDGAADDEAKATGAAGGDGDATSRTAAGTKAGAAAGTSAATAGSASGAAPKPAEAEPRTPGDAKPPSAAPAGKPAPAGRPSATLFRPTIGTPAGATPGSSADPVTGKTARPATRREAPSPAAAAVGRAPEAGSGTGKAGPGQAPARDGEKHGATEQDRAGQSGPTRAADGNAVVIVPGIARYHRTGCILIRFLGSDDLETSTAQEAEAKGCAPCRACEPDKPLSSGD
jgi:hypothetical protein